MKPLVSSNFSCVIAVKLHLTNGHKYTAPIINRRVGIAERKKTKGQIMIYKTLDRKLKIKQHKPH
jgi:hypothetical protein